MDNPELLATLGTQDKGQRQTKQKTFHRKLKRWATRITPKSGHFLSLIRHPPCYSYIQDVLYTTMRKQTHTT